MLNFLKVAQRQLNSEYEFDVPINPNNNNGGAVEQQKEIACLKERNRHLEAKIARLNNGLNGMDNEFIMREQACDNRAALLNSAIAKMHQVLDQTKQNLALAEQQHQQDQYKLQVAEQEIHRLNEYIHSFMQEKKYTQSVIAHEEPHMKDFLDRESFPSSNAYSSSFMSEAKEGYNVSPISSSQAISSTQSINKKHHGQERAYPNNVPFGYSNPNHDIYMRGTHRIEPENRRLNHLEKRVEKLSSALSDIKQCLNEITGMLGNQQKQTSGESVYNNIQNFLDAE